MLQTIEFFPLQTISWMSEQSITFSPVCMPRQVFCIMSISKQSLKPWYYWKIPIDLCWPTVVCSCIMTEFVIVGLVAWYTTCSISIQNAIIWTCNHFYTIALFCKLTIWYFIPTGHKIFFASYWLFGNMLSSGSNLFNRTSNSMKLLSLQPNRAFKFTKANIVDNLVKVVHP